MPGSDYTGFLSLTMVKWSLCHKLLPCLGRLTGTVRLMSWWHTNSDVIGEVGEATVNQTDTSVVCAATGVVFRIKKKSSLIIVVHLLTSPAREDQNSTQDDNFTINNLRQAHIKVAIRNTNIPWIKKGQHIFTVQTVGIFMFHCLYKLENGTSLFICYFYFLDTYLSLWLEIQKLLNRLFLRLFLLTFPLH